MPSTESQKTRIAHFADIHVREGAAFEGLCDSFSLARELGAEAGLLGGDIVMNSVAADLPRVEAQWREFQNARERFPEFTLFPCLGNQDVWGWNQKTSGCTGDEPLFGKAMFLRQMAIPRTYYATRLRSWRLIVLDSIQRGGRHGFYADLGATQRAWLESELQSDLISPTIIMSHIPIVAGPAEFFASESLRPDSQGQWTLKNHLIHSDSFELTHLFSQFKNVKLALSGHTHMPQKVEFLGISYIVSPPVSGAWWRGDFLGQPRGFTLVDLWPDGSFHTQSVQAAKNSQ